MKPPSDKALVLGVSGLLGLRLGWVAFPNWQVAVETAQRLDAALPDVRGRPPYVVKSTLGFSEGQRASRALHGTQERL